jgi:hypothetical protein
MDEVGDVFDEEDIEILSVFTKLPHVSSATSSTKANNMLFQLLAFIHLSKSNSTTAERTTPHLATWTTSTECPLSLPPALPLGLTTRETVDMVKAFFDMRNLQQSRRTINRMCEEDPGGSGCTDDKCCKPELAANSIDTYIKSMLRLVDNHELSNWSGVFRHPNLKQYVENTRREQARQGRGDKSSPVWFFRDAVQYFTHQLEQINDASTPYETLRVTQLTCMVAMTAKCGLRFKAVANLLANGLYKSFDKHTNATTYHVSSNIDKANLDSFLAQFKPSDKHDITCPVYWIERYLSSLDTYDCYIGTANSQNGVSPLLFPRLCKQANGAVSIRMNAFGQQGTTARWLSVTTDMVNTHLSKFCTFIDMPYHLTIHGLRGSKTIILLQQDISIKQLNAEMGWAANSVTWQQYARLLQLHEYCRPSSYIVPELGAFENVNWGHYRFPSPT